MGVASGLASRGGLLVGIDGGGTYSRGLCTDPAGNVLAYAEGDGTSPTHNSAARDNFRRLVADLFAAAGRAPGDVACLVAGLAGLDGPEDGEWAQAMTGLEGLRQAPVCVNDAVVAHAGALLLEPGIVAVLGTGSITIAVTEDGKIERDYDFGHYARATARHIAYDALIRVATETIADGDEVFVRQVLAYWGVSSTDALPAILREHAGLRDEASKRRFGAMAPLVTAAACAESPLAQRACDAAAEAIATSIRLVLTRFEARDEAVPVVLIGSVARSEYVRRSIENELQARSRFACMVVDPALPPVCGAVLMAAREVNPHSVAQVVSNLGAWASPTTDQ